MKNLIGWGLGLIVFLGLYLAVANTKSMAEIPMQNSDAEILGLVAVVDQNEIQIAQLAEQKHLDPHVLNYARMLEAEHKKNLEEVRHLSQNLGIKIEEKRGFIGQLRADGEHDLAVLSPLDQDNFSREFISDMIKGHSDVLTWINSQDTHNGQIKKLLDDTRKHVAMHLKKAQEIQEQVLK